MDVEVLSTIPLSEWKELRGEVDEATREQKPGLIANFLLEKDSISPAELANPLHEEIREYIKLA